MAAKRGRGQPPKGKDALVSRVAVRLKKADFARLVQAAKGRGVDPTTLARVHILDGLTRDERRKK
jgi:hypothetical protein